MTEYNWDPPTLVERLRAHKAMKIYRTLEDGTELYWLDKSQTNPLCEEAAEEIERRGRLIKLLKERDTYAKVSGVDLG